jgi:tyrosyl-DNA phosphodiesterase 2
MAQLIMGNEQSATVDLEDGKLKVLSWNIDGLDGNDTVIRTETACHLIQTQTPHIVFLQEVVPSTLKIINSKLGSLYSIHYSHTLSFLYFPAILVIKKSPKIHIDGEVGVFDFPKSTMGRHLLQLFVIISGIPVALYTSHLESMKDFSTERKDQLRQCFEFIQEQNELFSRICIFGGDLNLRDYEVAAVGLPPHVVDVWEACGSIEEHKYTWDKTINDTAEWKFYTKPRLRFDRLYLSPGDGPFLKPSHFELVGTEIIPRINRYASDHWGIWCVLDVSGITTDDTT